LSREAVGGRGRGPRGGWGPCLRGLLLLLAPALVTAGFLYRPVPGLEGLRRDPAGTLITDRHGEPLACLPGPEGAFQWELSREDVSAETRRIFLRVEDRRFDHHPGVDLLAAARAAALNLACGRTVSGASTISMQLARLVRPHRGGLGGKLAEALTAVRLEAQLGKREVLRLYLNHLPFGRNTVGLGAAAVRHFDRRVAKRTPAQLLILATIPALLPVMTPSRLRRPCWSGPPRWAREWGCRGRSSCWPSPPAGGASRRRSPLTSCGW